MDPVAAIRGLNRITAEYDSASEWEQGLLASELVTLWQGLSGWMARGGHVPSAEVWRGGE